jgi:hypothetical protein
MRQKLQIEQQCLDQVVLDTVNCDVRVVKYYVLYKLKIKQDAQCSYNIIVQRDKPIPALNERIS